MKKILISLSIIAAIAAIAITATTSFFSDTETSTGNTFTAGSLDLIFQVDGDGGFEEVSNNPLFSLGDVKPGDKGEATVKLWVDDNPSCGKVDIVLTSDFDNSCTEPEEKEEGPRCLIGDTEGELNDNMIFKIWKDDGANGTGTACNNVMDSNEAVLISGPLTEDHSYNIGELPTTEAGVCYGISWELPLEVTNIVQTDSFTANMIITALQKRNQFGDVCPIGEIIPPAPKFFVYQDNDKDSPGRDDNREEEASGFGYYEPYITWDESVAGQVTLTFHNPTPWLFVFDVRVDGEAGSDRDGIDDDAFIGAGPLAGEKWGPTYQRVVVDGRGTLGVHVVTQTFSGNNKIEVGLREGAERDWYIDWLTFLAQ